MASVALKPWLILDPVFVGKLRSGQVILQRFKKKKKNQERADKVPAKPADSFGILAIAVDPYRQGLGLGQLLMDDAETAALANDFSKMDLTVNPSNHGAVRFYEKLNWTKSYKNGIWKGSMVKKLYPLPDLSPSVVLETMQECQ
jgi:ribosomal protein S18 acetylase RimI-like enzyme